MECALPTHYKGDTFEGQQFTVVVNGSALNLANVSVITMDVRKSGNTKLILRLSTNVEYGGITVVDAPNGIFQIDEQIIDIPAEDYVYDIEFTFTNGKKKTYVYGTWTITQDVTHG